MFEYEMHQLIKEIYEYCDNAPDCDEHDCVVFPDCRRKMLEMQIEGMMFRIRDAKEKLEDEDEESEE